MIHRTTAFSKIQHSSKCSGNIFLCPLHGSIQVKSLCQIRSNGTGQSAAGSVRVGIVDPFSLEPFVTAAAPQKVVGIVQLMPTLAKHCAVIFVSDGSSGLDHIVGCLYFHSGKNLSLRNIRCEDCRHRKKLAFQSINCLVVDQLGSAGGYHNWIHNDVFGIILMKLLRNRFNQCAGRYHSNFHCVRINICENIIQLFCQKFWRCLHDSCHTGSILCGKCGDRTHSIYSIADHCLDISLDTGASAGVTSSDC